ncbi:MAG: four helix bundle protein [Verrucomicrobiaceae bacterium]
MNDEGWTIWQVKSLMKTDSKAKTYDLEERLIDFAVRVITVVEALPDTKAGRHIAGQLVRSGTSPAPNYGEAQSAESVDDFVHKLKVALKELRETNIWLKIIKKKPLCSPKKLESLTTECNELISIFVKSIQTAKHNAGKR